MKKRPPTVDYRAADIGAIEAHGMRLLVHDQPELSAILRGHMLIERVIEALISHQLKHPAKLLERHRLTFEFKADLAAALGVVPDDLLAAAKALSNIRNAYAHREDHTLTLDELNSLKVDWALHQQEAFKIASSLGVYEAARMATMFLYWAFESLLPQAKKKPAQGGPGSEVEKTV